MTLRAAAEQALAELRAAIAKHTDWGESLHTGIYNAVEKLDAALAAEQPQPEAQPPRFPTMLRKMWSGGEVQAWIDQHWIAPPPSAPPPEPSEAQVEAAWRAIPASHEDSRVSVITKGDVWVMLRAAAAARGR